MYNDGNGNGRFDLNEGLSGVTVSLGGGISITTNSAGGWSLRTSSGSKTVQCNGGSFVGTGTVNVTVDSDNIEVDFVSGNSSGIVNFKVIVSPTATITANGSGGTVNLNQVTNLSVACSLDTGSFAGEKADWWVAVNVSGTSTLDGWYYFDVDTRSWVLAGSSHTDLVVTHQGDLFNLAAFEVLNITGLPAGTYTFYFAVDTNMNGTLDIDELFFGFVVVNITP